jgi:hypothetical protein
VEDFQPGTGAAHLYCFGVDFNAPLTIFTDPYLPALHNDRAAAVSERSRVPVDPAGRLTARLEE